MSRAARLDALIERGLSALMDGDLEGAERKLAEARRIDSRHIDVLLLDAGIRRERGDDSGALDVYQRVIQEYPDDPVAYISAAELHLDAYDPDAALTMADRALELVDEEDELIAAVLAKVGAHVLRGDEHDVAAAREALAELSSTGIEDPGTVLNVAGAHHAVGELDTALAWLQRVVDDEEYGGDAWHGIGMVREDKGDRDGMIAAFLETRRRDLAEPLPPWHVTVDEFERIASAAFAELPEGVRERLHNVPMLIDDVPSEEMVRDGVDPRLLGLFQGVPMSDQMTVGGVPQVTDIHLFQRNLERFAQDAEELAEQIRITVLHETAHFFGLDDEDLEKLGLD